MLVKHICLLCLLVESYSSVNSSLLLSPEVCAVVMRVIEYLSFYSSSSVSIAC